MHGIGKQFSGERSLLTGEWLPALQDGLSQAGAGGTLADGDVAMAYYGDLFRTPGRTLAVGDPPFTSADVQEGIETDLLMALWAEAARVDRRVVPPGADTLARTPGSVQAGLRALSRSEFFAGVALRALVFDLKQVASYLEDAAVRGEAAERVWKAIGEDTQVVVAHSLGSVVAYEALSAMRGHRIRALVTLGSPLGIRNLIFERLRPEPGAWPGGEDLVWTNVVDSGDIVALVKDLRPAFGDRLCVVEVANGAHAHSAASYLTDGLTGAAVAGGLVAG
ncbi:hypothetical protein [Streptomyces sp. NPDC041003]|uniref:hypothetical protein n=1 Tax=Streptomyces sp. NPDC041003 TaxID=3155730 RepID=UPI00340198C9